MTDPTFNDKEKALLELNNQVNARSKDLQKQLDDKENYKNKIKNILALEEGEVQQTFEYENPDFLDNYEEKVFEIEETRASKPDLMAQIQKAKAAESLGFLQEIEVLKVENQKNEDIIGKRKEEIGVLDQQLTAITSQIREKDIIIEKMQDKGKGISEESKKFIKEITILNEKIENLRREKDTITSKLETQKMELSRNIAMQDELETDNGYLYKEIEAKDEKIKGLERVLEEGKIKIKEKRMEEIEEKEINTKENEKLIGENKKLMRQKNELLAAYKKMRKLIEVLKKQKTHLEIAGSLGFTEEEFIKALDLPEKMLG